MAISFHSALGIRPEVLSLREKRSEILSANIANADTPHFKARDLDFSTIFGKAKKAVIAEPQAVKMVHTNSAHFMQATPALNAEIKFRTPYQVSVDGNTVEEHLEQVRFAENSLQYQASLRFVGDTFAGLKSALTGQ